MCDVVRSLHAVVLAQPSRDISNGSYLLLIFLSDIMNAFVSQIGLANFLSRRKTQERTQRPNVQLIAMWCLTTTAQPLQIKIVHNGNASIHWVSTGPTANQWMIITGPTFMRKRLCCFIDDVPLDYHLY